MNEEKALEVLAEYLGTNVDSLKHVYERYLDYDSAFIRGLCITLNDPS